MNKLQIDLDFRSEGGMEGEHPPGHNALGMARTLCLELESVCIERWWSP